MNMNDKLNIEIDYREALRLYLILGSTNGPTSVNLWVKLRGLLDADRSLFDHFSSNVEKSQMLDYNSYYRHYEQLLFTAKKTPEQIQLEVVMDRIAELQHQANTLQNIIKG